MHRVTRFRVAIDGHVTRYVEWSALTATGTVYYKTDDGQRDTVNAHHVENAADMHELYTRWRQDGHTFPMGW